ncbi:MAG TPA: PilZ domain-containing protein [Terriglobales bacterium]|nr:PilZ domain-containing protein [Terriglobales bacterium]
MSSEAPIPVYGAQHHAAPQIAAFGLEAGEREHFANAFRNVKLPVDVVPVDGLAFDTVFDAAILRADHDAPQRLGALRASSQRMLIYLVGSMPDVARLASHGINAALDNLSDTAMARAVEHTYLLLAGKLRKYTRVPIYIPVNVQVDGLSFTAVTEDLSAGGISALAVPPAVVTVGKPVSVRLALPASSAVSLQGIVCWISADRVGIQFDRGLEQERLRDWVEGFLA